MDTQIDWAELLCMARERSLVLHYRQSFCLFPINLDKPLPLLILTVCRNFLAYHIRLIVDLYHPLSDDASREIREYLQHFALQICNGDNPRLFILGNDFVFESDAAAIRQVVSSLPIPPQQISDKIQIVYEMEQKLLELLKLPDDACGLYCLAAEWLQILGSARIQLFPVQRTLECAGIHMKQHIRRIDHHSRRSIEWGREYDTYLRKYLQKGFCEQTARARARDAFKAAHPAPVTDAELLCDKNPPGLSRQSLHKYHQVFLQFQAQMDELDTPPDSCAKMMPEKRETCSRNEHSAIPNQAVRRA